MRRLLAVILVLCLSFGNISMVHAQEIEASDNESRGEIDLLELPYIVYDADGNVVANKTRLVSQDIPAGGSIGWYVTIYNGKNTMSVGVNPSARLKLSLCNGLGIEVYSYTTAVEVLGTSTSFTNPEGNAVGIFKVYNLSNHSTTITSATFAGQ